MTNSYAQLQLKIYNKFLVSHFSHFLKFVFLLHFIPIHHQHCLTKRPTIFYIIQMFFTKIRISNLSITREIHEEKDEMKSLPFLEQSNWRTLTVAHIRECLQRTFLDEQKPRVFSCKLNEASQGFYNPLVRTEELVSVDPEKPYDLMDAPLASILEKPTRHNSRECDTNEQLQENKQKQYCNDWDSWEQRINGKATTSTIRNEVRGYILLNLK